MCRAGDLGTAGRRVVWPSHSRGWSASSQAGYISVTLFLGLETKEILMQVWKGTYARMLTAILIMGGGGQVEITCVSVTGG